MSTWNGFPREVRQWVKYFKRTYENIDKVLARVVWNTSKVSLITIELADFLEKFSQKTGTLTPDEILRCFEFLKGCAAFIGLLSNYQSSNWLTYCLKNDLNVPYNELAFLFSAWADTSLSFCYDSFQCADLLAAAHANDLVSTYKAISSGLDQFPGCMHKALRIKLNQIQSLLTINENSANANETNRHILKHRDWDIDEEAIGQGGYAVVHLAKLKSTGEKLAIKELKPAQLKPRTVGYLKREIDSMLHLDHPNLLKLVGVTVTQPFCIATSFIPNGDLFELLYGKKKQRNPTLLSQIALDVARGLEYLHANHMVHRDLKPPNVLMTENWRAVVCDFGLARVIGPKMSIELGTIQWMAPELLKPGVPYDGCVDVFAYGILLWELYTGLLPYTDKRIMQIAVGVLKCNLRPQFPNKKRTPMRDLIERCWATKIKDRPTMHEVVEILEAGEHYIPGCDLDQFHKWIEKTKEEHHEVMEKFYKDKHNPQTVVEQLKKVSPLDPQCISILQRLKDGKIYTEEVLDKVTNFAMQVSTPDLQSLAEDILQDMVDNSNINPDRLAFAVLRTWDTNPDFVVAQMRKLSTKIVNRQQFLGKLLSMSQPTQTIDIIEIMAAEEDIQPVLAIINRSHVVPVLSALIEKYGPSQKMLPAAVSSVNSIALMIRAVLKVRNLEIIGIPNTQHMIKNMVSVADKLNASTWGNTEKDANEVIRMLAPMFRLAGCGLGTLEILHIGAQYEKLAHDITELQLWGAIFGAFAQTNQELLLTAIKIIHQLPLKPKIYTQGWTLIVNNFAQTFNNNVLSLIKEILGKDQQFDVATLINALLDSTGSHTKKNIATVKYMLEIDTEKHTFTMEESFAEAAGRAFKKGDPNVAVAIAVFTQRYIQKRSIDAIPVNLFAEFLSYLYKQKPPFDAALPILDIILNAIGSPERAAFMVRRGLADYLTEMPILYPRESRVLAIAQKFSEALMAATK